MQQFRAGYPDAPVRAGYPDAPVRVAITRAARRFVTLTGLSLVIDRGVFVDAWTDEPYEEAPHVQIARWADVVVVYPATLHFVHRLAGGLADTPLLLALQCADVPIGPASPPPGGCDGAADKRGAALLRERPNVVVAEPVLGHSITAGEANVGAPATFPELLGLVHPLLPPAGR